MISIFYDGAPDLFPVDAVLGYEFTRRSRNVIHELIDNHVPAVTLRQAATRSGRLSLFFRSEEQAREALRIHALADVLYLSDDDHLELSMRYVVAEGDVVLTQDTATMLRWTLAVPFREVPA